MQVLLPQESAPRCEPAVGTALRAMSEKEHLQALLPTVEQALAAVFEEVRQKGSGADGGPVVVDPVAMVASLLHQLNPKRAARSVSASLEAAERAERAASAAAAAPTDAGCNPSPSAATKVGSRCTAIERCVTTSTAAASAIGE